MIESNFVGSISASAAPISAPLEQHCVDAVTIACPRNAEEEYRGAFERSRSKALAKAERAPALMRRTLCHRRADGKVRRYNAAYASIDRGRELRNGVDAHEIRLIASNAAFPPDDDTAFCPIRSSALTFRTLSSKLSG
ncbi:hypothetical protein [Methylobacterium terrae]|uniref:hypothetical protein n=1 Tax=Methylobacterium terrae TaxID=2202827 RepID=UPI0013A58F06|nr:hypothetical protein [Methylobacterium terrae]